MRDIYPNELMHYGVMGMKWGVRRYQPYSVVPRQSGKGGKEILAAKSAKQSQRDINKAERYRADLVSKEAKRKARLDRATQKASSSDPKSIERLNKARIKYDHNL